MAAPVGNAAKAHYQDRNGRPVGTSRSQLARLLDPKHTGVTIVALAKAAMVVGKRLKIEVMDEQGSPIAWVTNGSQRGLGKTWSRKQHKLAAA